MVEQDEFLKRHASSLWEMIPLRFTDLTAKVGDPNTYRVIAVNTVGLKSESTTDEIAGDDR